MPEATFNCPFIIEARVPVTVFPEPFTIVPPKEVTLLNRPFPIKRCVPVNPELFRPPNIVPQYAFLIIL